MVCSAKLKPILLTLLLIFAAALPRAAADEWISEEYRCALTIPTQESWKHEMRQALPTGDVIFHLVSMDSNKGLMITHVPDMPSSDILNPAMVKRIGDILESQGWLAAEPKKIVWKQRKFLQFIARRRDSIAGKQIGVARATIRERQLYIITAYGRGEADRTEDPAFMRVAESFRFTEKPMVIVEHATPPPNLYRMASLGVGAAGAALFLAFTAVWLRSRPRTEEQA